MCILNVGKGRKKHELHGNMSEMWEDFFFLRGGGLQFTFT